PLAQPKPTLSPYTTLFRSHPLEQPGRKGGRRQTPGVHPDHLPPQRHPGRELQQRDGQRLRRAGLLPLRIPETDAAHGDLSSVFPPAPDPLPADPRARDPAPADTRGSRPATETRPAS